MNGMDADDEVDRRDWGAPANDSNFLPKDRFITSCELRDCLIDIKLKASKDFRMTKTPSIWNPPTSGEVGWMGLDAEELREVSFIDGDPELD